MGMETPQALGSVSEKFWHNSLPQLYTLEPSDDP